VVFAKQYHSALATSDSGRQKPKRVAELPAVRCLATNIKSRSECF
jgi:hypothetical protein